MEEVLAVDKNQRQSFVKGLSRKALQNLCKALKIKANAKSETLVKDVIEQLTNYQQSPAEDAKENTTTTPALKSKENRKKRKSDTLANDEQLSPAPNQVFYAAEVDAHKVLAKTPLNPLYAEKRPTSRRRTGIDWAEARKAELADLQQNLQRLSTIKKPAKKQQLTTQQQPFAAAAAKSKNVASNRPKFSPAKPNKAAATKQAAISTAARRPPLAANPLLSRKAKIPQPGVPSSKPKISPQKTAAMAAAKRPSSSIMKKSSHINTTNKPPPTARPNITGKKPSTTTTTTHGVKPTTNVSNINKKTVAKPRSAIKPKTTSSSVGVVSKKPAAPSTTTKTATQVKAAAGGGGKQKVPVPGPYPNERARQAAEKYAERMKKAMQNKQATANRF